MIWSWYSSERNNSFRKRQYLKNILFLFNQSKFWSFQNLAMAWRGKCKQCFYEMLEITKRCLDFKRFARESAEAEPSLKTCIGPNYFISLVLAKGARLVAPGAAFSIYPQSRYSRRASHLRTNPCYDSSCQGTWWQEGDLVSALLCFPDASAVAARTGANSLHCVSGGRVPKPQGLRKGNNGESSYEHPRRHVEKEEPGIIFFVLYSSRLKMNEYWREQWGQRESMYWVQMRFICGLSHSSQLATHQAVWFIVPTG